MYFPATSMVGPDEIKDGISELLGVSDRPVVLYSAAWPFMRAMSCPKADVAKVVSDSVLSAVAPRTLLAPTFTNGFGPDGLIDLDREPGTSGAISEAIRLHPASARTASAFFSYSIIGADQEVLVGLRPKDAWGSGSVYDWMANNDVSLLMIGVSETTCSFIHIVEWLARELVPYRVVKQVHGRVVLGGKTEELRERLFVRRPELEAQSRFLHLSPLLKEAGLKRLVVGGIPYSCINARAVVSAILPAVRRDPLYLIENSEDVKKRLAAIEGRTLGGGGLR
jgi:aminoglycoside N3'-acetyltransferase